MSDEEVLERAADAASGHVTYAPMWEYIYVERYDDVSEGAKLMVAYLSAGWEPFAAEHNPGGVSRLHLRRRIQTGTNGD